MLGLLTVSMSVFPRKGFGVLHTRYTDDLALGVSKLAGALCFQKRLPSVEEGEVGLQMKKCSVPKGRFYIKQYICEGLF